MPNSADIGASFSSYTGNAALGGGTLGVLNIDTKPLEQLAQYVFLYNKAEYDQRQKDAEAAAGEIAALTTYDITTGIDKDRKILLDKRDALFEFIRKNPGAINYRDKENYLKFKQMQNDLLNDITGAKVRNLMYITRMNANKKITNKEEAVLREKKLMEEIEKTDIRTPIKAEEEFDVDLPKREAPPLIKFDAYKAGENKDNLRKFSMPDVKLARKNAVVKSFGLDKVFDPSTTEGQLRAITEENNFFTKGKNVFNAVLNAKDDKGNFLYKNKVVDASGNETYVLDESKLPGVAKEMVGLIKRINTELGKIKTEIKSGVYLDKFDKPITFGNGVLDESDYDPINYNDGISSEELAFIGDMAEAGSISYETETIKHDDAINWANVGLGWGRIAEERRQFDNPPRTTVDTDTDINMDLTGYAGQGNIFNRLSLEDIEAIDPDLVQNNYGQYQLSANGKKVKEIIVLPNGDAVVNPKYDKNGNYKPGTGTIRPRESYRKRAISISQRGLKERKGQTQQSPFTKLPGTGQSINTGTQTSSGLPVIQRNRN